jgi:1,4-alpha-glucan branching enzyme
MVEFVAINSITRRVPFVVKAPKAMDVRVTGDFTGWAARGLRLSHDGGGHWRTVLSLEPGEYQYRLLVDGAWADHAETALRVPNPYGSKNCVLTVL